MYLTFHLHRHLTGGLFTAAAGTNEIVYDLSSVRPRTRGKCSYTEEDISALVSARFRNARRNVASAERDGSRLASHACRSLAALALASCFGLRIVSIVSALGKETVQTRKLCHPQGPRGPLLRGGGGRGRGHSPLRRRGRGRLHYKEGNAVSRKTASRGN